MIRKAEMYQAVCDGGCGRKFLERIPNADICPPPDCPFHVKDFKECKDRCETLLGKGKRKINCTCEYFIRNTITHIPD